MAHLGTSSRSVLDSMHDTMASLGSLEEELGKLKREAGHLEELNREMAGSIARVESTYVKKVLT